MKIFAEGDLQASLEGRLGEMLQDLAAVEGVELHGVFATLSQLWYSGPAVAEIKTLQIVTMPS